MSHGTEGRDGPEHVKAMTAAVADRVPVRINRNFMNYPLARDARAQANWFRGGKTGRWMADLPGEERDTHRIRLILPADAPVSLRHCPSALDMNVLFQLLAEAQRGGGTTRIEFASAAVLLRRLGFDSRNRNRARLSESVIYWSEVSIRWPRWYHRQQYTKLTLPPPVTDAERRGNRLIVTLHPDWLQIACAKGYYAWLPLPLPAAAATQNLILVILTSELQDGFPAAAEGDLEYYFDTAAPLTRPMDRWWLTRKMGLIHKQRNRVLDHAVVVAARWFAENRGKLKRVSGADDDDAMPSRQVAFRLRTPRIPRRRVSSRVSSLGISRGPVKARNSVASFAFDKPPPDDRAEADGYYFELVEAAARGSRGATSEGASRGKRAVTWVAKGPRSRGE